MLVFAYVITMTLRYILLFYNIQGGLSSKSVFILHFFKNIFRFAVQIQKIRSPFHRFLMLLQDFHKKILSHFSKKIF